MAQDGKMNNKKQNWLPYVVYSLLSLAILSSLLRPGYILSLDLLFSPQPHYTNYFWGISEWPSSVYAANTASTWFYLILQGVARAIPSWLLEKLIFFLIFFLSGLGAHRLSSVKSWGAYFAGLLYMVNPFTYVRFIAGQWGVLWAYALTPFAICAFLELLKKGGRKSSIKVAVLSSMVGLLAIQGYYLLFLAFFLILIVKTVMEHQILPSLGQYLKKVGVSSGLFCALNMYWLLPLMANRTRLVQPGLGDFWYFAPRPTSIFGVAFDTASMYGFWRGDYASLKDYFPYWWMLFICILFLVFYGLLSNFKNKEKAWLTVSFGVIGIVSFPLALGASVSITQPFFKWLWEHLFFWSFRDSQKFVALLCLTYACTGALGVNELVQKLQRHRRRAVMAGMKSLIALSLIIPVAYSFPMFGFIGQIGVTDYPEEWYVINTYMNNDKGDFNTLFLPWHMYMDYSWLPNKEQKLINPAPQFFDKPVIAGDNIEIPGVKSQSINPVSKYIEFLLANAAKVDNMGELLAPLNVKYVMLVHETDYQNYEFLYHQKDLKVELEKPGITLFRNEYSTAQVYAVDSVIYINSLKDYLTLSQSQDVMAHLYIIGSGPGDNAIAQTQVLSFVKRSPVSYQIEGTSHKYIIFTIPPNADEEGWDLNGEKPLGKNLGFIPAFTSFRDGGSIIYSKFYHIYLPGFAISILAIGYITYIYFSHRPRNKLP